MDKLKNILAELGLTNSEIEIYLTLLKYGENPVGFITKKTQIHRRNIYDSLDRLIKKGFVSYIKKNNVKIYSILNPEILLEKINDTKNKLTEIMGDITDLFNQTKENKETLFFKGINGIKQIFEDQILKEKEIYVIATNKNIEEILKFFFPQYNLKRKEKKIKTKMLFSSIKEAKKLKNLPFSEIKYLENTNNSPMSQYIYGNNIAIILWSQEPFGILIREKEIAKGFKDNFNLLWKLGKII